MAIRLYDAHNHLADPVFDAHRDEIDASLQAISMKQAVVNGTGPDDWPGVLNFAKGNRRVLPAIGLHPWRVNDAPGNWKERFIQALEDGARAIGEIGLDQWIDGHDPVRQAEAFRWQLAQAARRNLPVSIHCLKATGPMMEILHSAALPQRGIHLHAFKASGEIVRELVELGAFFSFNGCQMAGNRTRDLETMRSVPDERILVETDAPDMPPPAGLSEFVLPEDAEGRSVNHPGNLRAAYRKLAEIRGIRFETFAATVEENYKGYFLS